MNEDWSHFEFQSDLPASETFHRSVSSLPPDTRDLPALHEDGLVELELLGEGGMGVVHAARDGVLGRVVATKRARPEAGARAVAALMAEARTLASLDHPNIVPVHALAKDASGAPVLVMMRPPLALIISATMFQVTWRPPPFGNWRRRPGSPRCRSSAGRRVGWPTTIRSRRREVGADGRARSRSGSP